MKKFYGILIGGLLAGMTVNGQAIIPFPDLSEHYDFRNASGGAGVESDPYAHLEPDYRLLLEAMDDEIILLRQRIAESDDADRDVLQNKLEELTSKRDLTLKEAELQSDLFDLHK